MYSQRFGATSKSQKNYPDMNQAATIKQEILPMKLKETLQELPTMFMKEDKEVLYDFPALPNLTLDERRKLSQTACILFHSFNGIYASVSDMHQHLRATNYYYPSINLAYFGPHGTRLSEFVKLPEIACIIYPTKMTDKLEKSPFNKYRSYIEYLRKYPIHKFRFLIVQCFKEATEEGITGRFGTLTLEELCNVFNNHQVLQKLFGEKIGVGRIVKRFGRLTVMEALCCFCSRELVIRTATDNQPIKLRLRNHPSFLMPQIEKDRLSARKALEFYQKYIERNVDGFDWNTMEVDRTMLGCNPDLIFVSNYSSYFIDNVYAAIHHSKDINSYSSLFAAIKNYTLNPPDYRTFRSVGDKLELNLLIEMVSPEALEAVEMWTDEKKNVYMKIANELASSLPKVDREFAVDFIDVFPKKSPLIGFFFPWTLRRIARHILLVTQQPTFISKKQIMEKILVRFKYNLLEWLQMLGIGTFEELFENYEIYNLLAAIMIKRQNDIYLYRNMVSIMNDRSLVLGFPFSTRKELLNCLQQGLIFGFDEDGYIDESRLFDLYLFCYKRDLYSYERQRLFGGNNYLQEFLYEFGVEEIGSVTCPNGERFYYINTSFDEEYPKILEEKKKCLDAVKTFLGIVEQLKKQTLEEPTSNFTAWKKNASTLNYEFKIYKETRQR